MAEHNNEPMIEAISARDLKLAEGFRIAFDDERDKFYVLKEGQQTCE